MSKVVSGVDRIIAGSVALPANAAIALLSNRAARTAGGEWTGHALQRYGYPVRVFLAPEHGLDVSAADGEPVPHSSLGSIPVLSMYRADRGRVEEALSKVDHLVVDLPDVGCRYYTYGWTMREALKLAARHGVSVTVLDRPNPLGGAAVEGNQPETVDSPVCASSVPVRHGLTLGELARWQQRTLELAVDLSVVRAEGWKRSMLWPEMDLAWFRPSPALRSFEAALVYPGTALLEGTNISEGRGTDNPFIVLGAPFIHGMELATRLGASPHLRGATVTPASFTPSVNKWAREACNGIALEIHDSTAFQPVRAGVEIINALAQIDGFCFHAGHFDALAGGSSWRVKLEAGRRVDEIAASWERDERTFDRERVEVALYE